MRKLVIRTDDVGYTRVHNLGTFETYEHGYATSADVMLDSPGTEDALKKLREMPWVSVGWHTHFWNSPVLSEAEVGSLLIPGTNRFRHDLMKAEDVDQDEALKELRAELERCMDILGRAPDTGGCTEQDTPFKRAMSIVTAEYGLACDFGSKMHLEEDGSFSFGPVAPRWKDRHIFIVDQRGVVAGGIIKETIREQEEYDPVAFLLEDRSKFFELPEDAVLMHGFHPAYLDHYVAKEGDYGPNRRYYTLSRVFDVEGLCSKRLHDWIKEHDIELCNLRDALYGTREYQNHLRHIGSDLCVY